MGLLDDKITTAVLSNTIYQINNLKYIKQILEGVKFLHFNNIFHSDIKPANILFTNTDDIKICDFGIALHMHSESSVTTSTSNFKRDRLYMSPERLANDSRIAENDIWSVGATFVSMISGHLRIIRKNRRNIELHILKYLSIPRNYKAFSRILL